MSAIIKKIDTSTTHEFFPDQFSNEIYYSRTNQSFEPFAYNTNLTIKYVHHGLDIYSVGKTDHRLRSNQYLILNAGNQVVCQSGEIDNEGMSIFMDPAILSEVYWTTQNPNILTESGDVTPYHLIEFPHYCDNQIGRVIENLFRHSRHCDLMEELGNSESLFYQLAEHMIYSQQEIKGRIRRIPRIKRIVREEIYQRVMVAKVYVMENFKEKVTVEELSQVAGLSKYYLIKCFGLVYGVTPYQYVQNLRINNAKNELSNGVMSISEISVSNGFADLSSFSKKFKQAVGVSPKVFQQKHESRIFSLGNVA